MYNEQPIDLSTCRVSRASSRLGYANGKWESKQLSVPSMGSRSLNSFRILEEIWILFRKEDERFFIDIDYRFEIFFLQKFTRRLICYRWRKSKLVILYMFIEDINMYMTAHWWSKFVIKDRWKREHFFTLINHNFVRHENERHVKISSVKVCLLASYWLTSFMYSRFTMPLKSQESIQNRTVKNKAPVSR